MVVWACKLEAVCPWYESESQFYTKYQFRKSDYSLFVRERETIRDFFRSPAEAVPPAFLFMSVDKADPLELSTFFEFRANNAPDAQQTLRRIAAG